jgi:hypothetical protein
MQAKIYLALAGRLVNATITPRGRDEGQGQGEKTIFLHGMIRFYGLLSLQ